MQFWPSVGDAPLLATTDGSLLANATLVHLAGAFGIESSEQYLVLCLLVSLIALCLPLVFFRGDRYGLALAVIVVAGGAVPPVLLSWVGGYDAAFVAAVSLGVLARNRVLCASGWLLAGFSHYALAAAGLILWLIVLAASRQQCRANQAFKALAASLGVLVGWLAARFIADSWGGSADRWSLFRSIRFEDLANSFLASWYLIIFSSLGIAWLLLSFKEVWLHSATRGFAVSAVVASVALPLVAADETRIAALALLPAALAWISELSRQRQDAAPPNQSLRILVLASLIVPVPVIWMGVPIRMGAFL